MIWLTYILIAIALLVPTWWALWKIDSAYVACGLVLVVGMVVIVAYLGKLA